TYIVIFYSLYKESMYKIFDIELQGFLKRVEELCYQLSISDKAKQFIVDKGFDRNYGARPLKRAIQQYIEDELAEVLLAQTDTKGKVHIDLEKNDEKIVTSFEPFS
ncbi:MAG: ATP-dependent Clp protease ATP-binding subunit, partial [Muribaculaceae bacterium]|nr:ATP-dependent Clp protease ATP-binding subunit [Muribaculaceae bacterium]